MILLFEKKIFVFIFVKMLMLMWLGGEMLLWKWWNVIFWIKKKRRKKMNYCYNLVGGSIDIGEGYVEYFR